MTAAEDSRLDRDDLTNGEIAARWFWILGPLLAALAQQELSYAFVTWACVHRMIFVLSVPALLALAVTAIAAVTSRREYNRETRDSPGSSRFFAITGLFVSALSAALILAMWLPTLFIDPCRLY
jgi:hypothetical protein